MHSACISTLYLKACCEFEPGGGVWCVCERCDRDVCVREVFPVKVNIRLKFTLKLWTVSPRVR